jgi:hypothetical protein
MPTFRCYICLGGTNVIRAWYSKQDDAIRGEMAAVIETLSLQPRNQWAEALFKPLERRASSLCVGLDEIILVVGVGRDKIHLRILGFCGPGPDDFTMLYAFNKKLDPKYGTPCEVAQTRKQEVQNDWTRAEECEFP